MTRNMNESKKHNPPKDVVAAINKANRDEDIKNHGKSIAFRTTKEKNPKAYNRKEGKKVEMDEATLMEVVKKATLKALNEMITSGEETKNVAGLGKRGFAVCSGPSTKPRKPYEPTEWDKHMFDDNYWVEKNKRENGQK